MTFRFRAVRPNSIYQLMYSNRRRGVRRNGLAPPAQPSLPPHSYGWSGATSWPRRHPVRPNERAAGTTVVVRSVTPTLRSGASSTTWRFRRAVGRLPWRPPLGASPVDHPLAEEPSVACHLTGGRQSAWLCCGRLLDGLLGRRDLRFCYSSRSEYTGCGAAWLARLTGGQEVGSSNLPSPTSITAGHGTERPRSGIPPGPSCSQECSQAGQAAFFRPRFFG